MQLPRGSAALLSQQDLVDLLARIAARDVEALAAFYDATSARIYSFVLRMMGNSTATEEVLFATFQAVWQQASTYQSRPHPPLLWVLKIALDLALARRPVRRRLELVTTHDDEPTPHPLNREALNDLLPEHRTALELAYYSGANCSEIAKILDQSPELVKRHIYLALLHLRKSLLSEQNGVNDSEQPAKVSRTRAVNKSKADS